MIFKASTAILPPRWVQWTKVGNVQMQSEQWDLALYSYGQAATIIGEILALDSGCCEIDYVHLYVVSCHNLSDAHMQLQSHVDAHTLRLKAHYQVSDWMLDRTVDSAVRYAAHQALIQTLMELMNFYELTAQPDRIKPILSKSQMQAAQFLQEIKLET